MKLFKFKVILLLVCAIRTESKASKFILENIDEHPSHLTMEDYENAKNIREGDQDDEDPKTQQNPKLFQGDIAMEKPEEIRAFTRKIYREDPTGKLCTGRTLEPRLHKE